MNIIINEALKIKIEIQLYKIWLKMSSFPDPTAIDNNEVPDYVMEEHISSEKAMRQRTVDRIKAEHQKLRDEVAAILVDSNDLDNCLLYRKYI